MNHLGHLILSGNDPLTITGNFMADAVKGRDLSAHSAAVQRGIRIHRTIDTFTDQHPLTRIGRDRLRAHCGKFAGVALDIFYDHCIALSWKEPEPLPDFAQRMYRVLGTHAHLMPERAQRLLRYLTLRDGLTRYGTLDGIASTLEAMAVRTPAAQALVGAERVMSEHLDDFVAECSSFLAGIRTHLARENG